MIEEVIDLEHIRINVRYSNNNKPVILFIHFSGGNLNMWNGILPQFENDYSIIAPDIRGHGKSDKPLTGYHIEDMAKDIYVLLKKRNIECCHIVGSSMGAEIGLCFAASHPEFVKSLVCEGALYNEFGEFGLWNGTETEIQQKKEELRIELAQREERIYKTKEEYIEEVRAELEPEGLWNDNFLAFFENNLQQKSDGNYTYCYLNHTRTEYIQKYWDIKFEEYYKKVKCPILFLPSEEEWKDEKIRASLSSFTKLLNDYEIEHIDNSIHAYVWMQLPLTIGHIVKNFIDQHER